MPRKKYIATDEFCYHTWARSANREWFGLTMEETWRIFSEQLYFAHHAFNLRIHSFVLMNNHYHMISRTPDRNLAEAMNFFQGEVSRCIGRASGRINQIFGGPYGWSIIRSPGYYLNAYKYVYRNPLEVNLASKAESYPFSTLNGLLGARHLLIPVVHDDTLFADVEHTLKWLNTDYPTTDFRDAIGRGLKRKEFSIPKKFAKFIES